jgi:hypothetical protein
LRLRSAAIAIALIAAGRAASAQTPAAAPPPDPPTWDLSASLYNYFLPNDRDYLQPTIGADRGWLHLEARANYEGRGTGSAWLGWNLSAGSRVVLDVTPMLGVVFGDTHGLAAGGRSTLGWRGLEIFSESEYVFDSAGRPEWFFYNWSELTLSPVDWFRFGLAAQRTRVYDSERDVQRGFLVGFSLRSLDIAAYVFDPDDANPTYVLNATVNFSLPRRR